MGHSEFFAVDSVTAIASTPKKGRRLRDETRELGFDSNGVVCGQY